MAQLLSFKVDGKEVDPPIHIPQGNAPAIINNAISIFLIAGIVAATITIIWAGIQWASSAGDKQKLAQAKARLTWGIIGLIVMIIAIFILNVVGSLFGVNLTSTSFTP